MFVLNLPTYSFKTKTEGTNLTIFDEIRKKFIILTHEEWVRQNFVKFLIHEKKFPSSMLAIEKAIKINKLIKRCDILLYSKNGNPLLLVECKSPKITITSKAFEQAAVYNMKLKVKYVILTNGLNHFCGKMDYEQNSFEFLSDIPSFEQL